MTVEVSHTRARRPLCTVTNRINAGYDLIPVAIARHPGQAVPLAGSWFGKAQDYLGMSVSVVVRKLGDLSDPSE